MKSISFPQKNETLAEFLGICFGDGCISVNERNHDYRLTITGHLIDDELYMKNYLHKMVHDLFRIYPKYRKQRGNTLILEFRSVEAIKFLNEIGMQIGRKTRLEIPQWIKSNLSFMKSFVRGFADTDGCLTFKKRHQKIHYYPTISVSSLNEKIVLDIHKFLSQNGFEVGKVVKSKDSINGTDKLFPHFRIYLYGKKNLEKWIDTIGFSNNKHMSKYLLWKQIGSSPSYSSTPDRIKIIKNPPSEI